MPMKKGGIFRFGDFQVDVLARTVRRQDTLIPLNRRAFDVLLYFVHDPGRVLSKDELLKNVWPDAFVDENSLAQSISVLRKALEEKPGENNYIVTLPGRGYQFISPVEVVTPPSGTLLPALSGEGMGASNEIFLQQRTIRTSVITEEKDPRPSLVSRRRVTATLAALAVVAGVALAGSLAWRHFHPNPPAVKVVVADFENSTGEAEFDHILRKALQIDLEQSPFLNLLTRSRVQETLAEMQRKPSEPLTPALAREVCERNNAQAMLSGTISKVGTDYVLILEAEACASGNQLASYKAQVPSKEAVLAALDRTVGHVRKQMGESAASRERFQVPIAQATTPSLDALRAYSQAAESFEHGDLKASQTLLEHAIALDPSFASAYRSLGNTYYNRADFSQAAVFYKKAFDLRERTTERERLSIEIAYYSGGIFDYEEAIRSLQLFTQIYPDSANSWGNLCNLYTQLGEYPQAIAAGQQALHLDPHSGFASVVLARAYKRANRFAEAKAVADATVAAGKDSYGIHSILFQIAYAEHDKARIKSEGEWELAHPNHLMLDDLALAAATGGRLREASDILARARTESLQDGDEDFADATLIDLANILVDFGEPSRAAAVLKQMSGDGGDPGRLIFLRAQTGDLAPAQHFIGTASPGRKSNTLNAYCDLPLVRALLALKGHKAEAAVQLLEPARIYQLRDFRVPYLRAQAETEANRPEDAAGDYRLILNNPGVDPIAPLYSISHLGLARVLVLQNKPGQARDEYRAFLEAWKNADPEIPLLIQAKQEYEKLGR